MCNGVMVSMVYILSLSSQLENVFTESANSTFSKYNQSNETDKRDAWNSFQKTVRDEASICWQGRVGVDGIVALELLLW